MENINSYGKYLSDSVRSYIELSHLKYKIKYKEFISFTILGDLEDSNNTSFECFSEDKKNKSVIAFKKLIKILEESESTRKKVLSVIKENKEFLTNVSEFCKRVSVELDRIEDRAFDEIRRG